jgi:hypothetical protein
MTFGLAPGAAADGPALDVRPLTPDCWDALVDLFGANGAAGRSVGAGMAQVPAWY